jgi:hypothetical protein
MPRVIVLPGLRWFRINGVSVSPEEYQRRLEAAEKQARDF